MSVERKGKPIIEQTKDGGWLGEVPDEWQSPMGIPVGSCGNKGSIIFSSVVKVIPDPDGQLEKAWRSSNRQIVICNGSNTVNTGSPDEPAGWKDSVGTSTGSASNV